MPPNYREQQGQPLTPREKKGALWLASLLVAGALGVGAWQLSSGGGGSRTGRCISATIASSTGGATVSECGTRARALCAGEAKATGPVPDAIRAACRKAGFPVG